MEYTEVTKMFEHLNAAILACDANFKVIYQNEKCRQIFSEVFAKADYIGCDLTECHPPAATKKVQRYFKEYKNGDRDLDYYIVDEPSGKVTVVNVPFYEGNDFKGVVEFIFNSSLG